MRRCPKCQNWTLEFDEYFGRFRCFDPECGWMPPSTAEREIRLLRSQKQPVRLDPFEIPELGLTLTPFYDAENDALSVDFGLDESTFDLPEPDGRMIWRIGRRTDVVAGFTIVGIREWAISEITVEFIARRKSHIERGLRGIPGAGAKGRATRQLIEGVVVTAILDDVSVAQEYPEAEDAWKEVVHRLEELGAV